MATIYLISSNSFNIIDEEIKKITKKNPYDTFDLNSVELEEVLEEAAYFSLFDEEKYMVVKNATMFTSKKNATDTPSKKDDLLIKYLESPNPNTNLIFTVNGKIDSKKKICKLIKTNYNLIEVGDLKPKEIVSKLDHQLKEDGYKCNTNTLYYIVNNSLNNYDLAISELKKIELYYQKPAEIKDNDVRNILSYNIEDNNFKFIDAIMKKDIKESFKIYDDLMLQKTEPIMLMSMLSKEIRNTLLVKKMLSSNTKTNIMKTLGINYDFQIDKIINNSYLYKEKELENLLVLLCDLDYKIKTGKIKNKLALEMFILNINK